MSIVGIHHVGLVSSDLPRTLHHYTYVLGLKLLRQTERHALVGVAGGAPGGLLAIEERAGTEPGREGVGGTHHFAWLVETRDALLQWKRWLNDHEIAVNGPLDRHYFESIYHRDPDGQVIEIATRGAGWTRDEAPDRIGTEHRPPPPEMLKGNMERERILKETWPQPVSAINDQMRFPHMHHLSAIGDDIVRSHDFVHGALGMRRVKRTSNFDMPDSYHWYWGVGAGAPGTVITYFERKGARRVQPGPGQISHWAVAVENEAALHDVRDRVLRAGFNAGEVEDGERFATEDPNGQRILVLTNNARII